YRGDLSVTVHGYTCQEWRFFGGDNWPGHGLENNNHCRNPNKANDRAWCFVKDSSKLWDYCDVQDCSTTEYSEIFASTVKPATATPSTVQPPPSTKSTASLRQSYLQHHQSQNDYRGTLSVTKNGHTCKEWLQATIWTNQGLENNNHCRNPNKIADKAWCWVDDSDIIWDYCEVPSCSSDLSEEETPLTYIPKPKTARPTEKPTALTIDTTTCGSAHLNLADYRGSISTTVNGDACQDWSSQSPQSHQYKPNLYPDADLQSNYCRNPGGEAAQNWCYTTNPEKRWEWCSVPVCP
ncbi:hypothetical protein THAPSDRAFT_261727, partial [Thalassiosira pseudonana CCMP1335]